MRYLLIPLLLCSTSRAAIIEPIGGSWTDGTTTANYVEVAPRGGEEWRYEMLLTLSPSSHVYSEVRGFDNGGNTAVLWIDNTIDFYDGAGDLGGSFAFDTTTKSFVGMADWRYIPQVQSYINGIPQGDMRNLIYEPQRHVLTWDVAGIALNLAHRSGASAVVIPEPSSVLLVGLAIAGIAAARCGRGR